MKYLLLLFLSFSACSFSQVKVEATLTKITDLEVHSIVGITNFGTLYYTEDQILYKKDSKTTLSYSNIQLGNITTTNAFNPLKINLFYKNFNTAIILDNRLAEIYKIDFNTMQPYKNISHITAGYDTTIWLFNTDSQQLELFDYKTNKTRATSMPIASNALALTSNYNFCWLLTDTFLYKFNYFGSLVYKIENIGFTEISEDNGNLVVKSKNQLSFLAKESETFIPIKIDELLINQFLVTNETLYIYDSKKLHQYQLKIN